MGRIYTVDFDESNQDYYMCKLCTTHIALHEDFDCVHLDIELCGGVFHKAVNLQVDEPIHHRQVDGHTVADIYCVKCGDKLGLKYIRVSWEDRDLQKDDVKLHMNKLLRKYGDQILYAETMEPVPGSP